MHTFGSDIKFLYILTIMFFRKQLGNNINDISDISIKKADIQFSALNLLSQYQLPKKEKLLPSTIKKKKTKQASDSNLQYQNSVSTKQKSKNDGEQTIQKIKQRSNSKHTKSKGNNLKEKNNYIISTNNFINKKQENIKPLNIDSVKIRSKTLTEDIKKRTKSSGTYIVHNNFHNNINICQIPQKVNYNPNLQIPPQMHNRQLVKSRNKMSISKNSSQRRPEVRDSIRKSRSTTSVGRISFNIQKQQQKHTNQIKQNNRKIIMRDYFGQSQQQTAKQVRTNKNSRNKDLKSSKQTLIRKIIVPKQKSLKKKQSRGKFTYH